jgi:23S rRNA (adenine1618-N6)-methyltransferase
MSSYDNLHPKNPFKSKRPNINQLINKHPLIFSNWNGKLSKLDWTNQEFCNAFTSSLMLEFFNISLTVPKDHICPPLPNRINYLCWLSDLYDSFLLSGSTAHSNSIIDIGVGAICIYPLLGSKIFNWKFYGSDIDVESIESSKNIVLNNNLNDSIELHHVSDTEDFQNEIISSGYINQFKNNFEKNSNDQLSSIENKMLTKKLKKINKNKIKNNKVEINQ